MSPATVESAVAEAATSTQSGTVFSGQPVLTEVVVSAEDGDWENLVTQQISRWAVCLFKDLEDPYGYVTAEVIGIAGVASEGPDRNAAIANIKEALQLALDDVDDEPYKSLRTEYKIPSGGEVVYVSM